ncbi:conserved oligomeric Golgi complex subunit 3 [Diaphorina citri]|uniref:Conserved oligomeric Golgi complex subunit 3 n=1 Tax=Diaphorina citri TaxID=121845 RepID=A0A1S3DHN3_DIACI|nr:conserved oligomeric Golgi complex subunit 3 [Diaphorina citri]
MVDVAKTVTTGKLQDWENTLAPLSKSQRTSLQELDDDATSRPYPAKFLNTNKEEEKKKSSLVPDDINAKLKHIASLNSIAEFLMIYSTFENDWMDQENFEFEAFRIEMEKQQNECNSILDTVNASLQKLEELKSEYNLVSGKTNSLHKVSQQLLLDQTRLNELDTEISQHVKHYKDIDRINQLLDSAQLNVSGEMFGQLLNDIDVHLVYINSHRTYKDSGAYLVRYGTDALDVLQRVCQQLLQDTEERLVFRANIYLQSDILNYNPSPGDLAYPEKLEVMAKISESLSEPEERGLHRVGSHSSLISEKSTTCEEVRSINRTARNVTPDLQGLWYPPVRRTLVCLSRLYRCVEKPIFQGVSQEAVSMCIQSVAAAASKISAAKSPIDGELFQIKHLLILREQIAPFQVDFTSKEVSLDFNKVKSAAYSLLQKRGKLFSLDSTNSILELLLEGAPFIKENTLDSRKEVDRQLKGSCETLIRHATMLVAGSLQSFVDRVRLIPKTFMNSTLEIYTYSLLQKRGKLFSLDSTNSILELLLEGAPFIKENTLDSRKEVDRQLKGSCETLIRHATMLVAGSLQSFVDRVKSSETVGGSTTQPPKPSASSVATIVQETLRKIKEHLAPLQKKMALYLVNPDTQFILYRPIKNNVIGLFASLHSYISSHYSAEDLLIIACPTSEQVSILLSSVSLVTKQSPIPES